MLHSVGVIFLIEKEEAAAAGNLLQNAAFRQREFGIAENKKPVSNCQLLWRIEFLLKQTFVQHSPLSVSLLLLK